MRPGEIYAHDAFYRSSESGIFKRKYLLALVPSCDGDVVTRLLTSRSTGRPADPPCFHGDPYPGYFLGVLGHPLTANSWVDLRHLDDVELDRFEREYRKGMIRRIAKLPHEILLEVLGCVAGANDTTRAQERAIRDWLSRNRS